VSRCGCVAPAAAIVLLLTLERRDFTVSRGETVERNVRSATRPHITPSRDATAWGHGRWGPRRVRVAECWATIRAEEWYSALLKEDPAVVRPGAKGVSTCALANGYQVTASWEVRANAVWRRGRLFLRCPSCGRRCTRLYVPKENAGLACRTCWGLTYDSRTRQNYKDSLYGHGQLATLLGTTQRDLAFETTAERRAERRAQSRERWARRRRYLDQPR
jgi:hypothetical protein